MNATPRWRRLAIFDTHFNTPAAEVILNLPGEERLDTHRQLEKLVAERRLTLHEGDAGVRYTFPETLRADERERMDKDEAAKIYLALAEQYARLAEQMLENAFGAQRATWMRALELDYPNIQAVLGWLVEHDQAQAGLRLAFFLQEFWFDPTYTDHGLEYLSYLLDLPSAAERSLLRAQCLDLTGALVLHRGDVEAAQTLKEEALSIFREHNARPQLAYALLHYGHLHAHGRQDTAAALQVYMEALALLQDLEDIEGQAHAQANLAITYIDAGEYTQAAPYCRQALQTYRRLGSAWEQAQTLGNAAGIAAGLERPELALRLGGAAAVQRERLGVALPPVQVKRFETMLLPARKALTPVQEQAAWAAGQALDLDSAVEEALNWLA